MLHYQNDSWLLDRETANDLIKEGKDYFLFLNKRKKSLNLYSALIRKSDFQRKQPIQNTPYLHGFKLTEKVVSSISSLPIGLQKNNHAGLRSRYCAYLGRSSRVTVADYKSWFKKYLFS